jgi:hypothetical protein
VRIGVLVAAICILALPARAAAEEATFALTYDAPEDCPSREAFVREVMARAPGAREVAEVPVHSFRVAITREAELVRGRVVLGDGASAREVPPAPCADVADSAAIMIALVLAGERAPIGPEGAPAPDVAKPPPEPEPTPEPTAPVEPKGRESPRPSPARAAEPEQGAVTLRAGVWGAYGLELGPAPFPAHGGSAGGELALDIAGALRPSLRVGGGFLRSNVTVTGRGDAEFRLLAVVVRLCPHAFELWRRMTLHACALVEVGELTARGRTENRLVQRMPWVAFGAAPRFGFALSRVFALEGEVGASGVGRHDRFVFQPDAAEVHDVPPVSVGARIGVAARFP